MDISFGCVELTTWGGGGSPQFFLVELNFLVDICWPRVIFFCKNMNDLCHWKIENYQDSLNQSLGTAIFACNSHDKGFSI